MQEWKNSALGGIQLLSTGKLNSVMYADDRVLISKLEDDVQILLRSLNTIAEEKKQFKNVKNKSSGNVRQYQTRSSDRRESN